MKGSPEREDEERDRVRERRREIPGSDLISSLSQREGREGRDSVRKREERDDLHQNQEQEQEQEHLEQQSVRDVYLSPSCCLLFFLISRSFVRSFVASASKLVGHPCSVSR